MRSLAEEPASRAIQLLRGSAHKVTPQRVAIIESIFANPHEHLSAEDIYAFLHADHPDISLATVYRTLDILADIGVLQKITFGDGPARYELTRSSPHYHHHLICTRCGRVTEFEEDLLEPLEQAVLAKTGFVVVDHEVKLFGLCPDCQAELRRAGRPEP